ncbi:armadillo-type protein [Umbelopsis sp. PMI_123]|nr:armadillo-type protein [Umbelopsis sp. PMI_123]
MVILELLTVIPEDITTAQLMGGRRLQIMQELKDGLPYVLSKLENVLSDQNYPSKTEEYNISLKKKALKCFQSWIQYGISPEEAHNLLQKSAHLLTNDIYLEEIADVLVEIMQLPKVTAWSSIRQHLQDYIGSPWFMTRLSESIRDEDEQTTRILGRITVTYGETFTETIADHMDQPGVLHLLELIMNLTTFPGYFGEDQEISEIPLNFWYVLQETLADKDWLPVTADKHKVRDGMTNEVVWLDKNFENTFVVYRQLVLALRDKAMLPPEAEFTNWSKGKTYLHWRLEASFFSLYSISDEIPAESSSEIAQLFEFNIFGQIPSNASPRLQNMALNCVGSLSEWLKNHPQYLLNVLNYIIPALSNAKLAQAAASSLKNVCDTCRAALVDGIDSLIALYKEPTVKQKVVESISAVIQVLQPEKMITPLMALIGDIIHNIQHILPVVQSDPVTAANNVQAQLQYLTACCRGLQSPNDDYQSLVARNAAYDMFASGSINVLYESVPGAAELSRTINDTITQIVYLYSKDQETTQVLCQFLDAGLRSMSPLACLPLSTLLFIIQHSYESQPLTPWLDTSSLVFTVYGGYDAHRDNLRQLLAILTTKTLSGINNIQGEKHKHFIGSDKE